MNLIIALLFYSFGSLLIIFKTGEARISYESLIKKVYDEYETFNIIVATTDHRSFGKITALQMISREMSARGIELVVVKFEQLEETVKFHHIQSARPLIVIYIDTITEIQEFKKGIVDIDMSYPVWLILFTGDEHEDICGYCRHPIGNSFNMEMMLLCCNSSSLIKWNWKNTKNSNLLSRDQEIEKVNEIDGKPSKILTDNRQFLVHEAFRITVWEQSNYIWRKDNELHGYLGEIVNELSRVMNFNISYVSEEPLGIFHTEASECTGVIGTIAQGKADIGVAEFSMSSTRIDIVDFSSVLFHGEYALSIAKRDHFSVQWNVAFKVFHLKVWIVIGILVLITPLLLTIIEYKQKDNLLEMISMHYLNVWGLFCMQEWSGSILGKSTRIIYLSLFISALVVNASYSAALIRYLTTGADYTQFRDVKEFVNDGTYEVIAIGGGVMEQFFQDSNDPVLKKMEKLMRPDHSLPTTRGEALQQLCSENVAFLHITNRENLQLKQRAPCETINLKLGGNFPFGLILPLKSEYTGVVNYHIRSFWKNGVLSRLRRKYYEKSDPPDISYKSVTFENIVPVLMILVVGCSIALIIFSQEMR